MKVIMNYSSQPQQPNQEEQDKNNIVNMTMKMKIDQQKKEEDDVMKDHSSSTTSHRSDLSMQGEDDDSMASLDGAIPSMAQFYNDNDDDEGISESYSEDMEEDNSSPSIYYLGREYSADQFRNSASVLSQSTRLNGSSGAAGAGAGAHGGRRNMTSRLLDVSDHRTNDKWSLLESEVMALSPKGRSSTSGKKLSKSEHWNSSRRRASKSPKRRTGGGGGGVVSPIPNTRGTRIGSGGGGRRQRRATITTAAIPPPPYSGDVSPKSTTATTTSPKSRIGRFFNGATTAATNAMTSQSDYFGSTRRRSSLAVVPGTSNHSSGGSNGGGSSGMSQSAMSHHSGHNQTAYRGGRRASSAGDYMRQAVGKFITLHQTEEEKKKERWQHSLERWGYTNHDVLGIVEDERIFAKLQHDLRQYQAVTNNVIQQKIHVFVSNTKMRRHTLHQNNAAQVQQAKAAQAKAAGQQRRSTRRSSSS